MGNQQKIENIDWLLSTLVSIVNQSEIQITIGITIITHGFLISGELIGGKEYFNEFAKEFTNGDESMNSIREVFSNQGDEIYNNKTESSDISKLQYIHLKNARYFHPGEKSIPTNKSILYRGRLAEVSGFTLGILSVN